GRALSAHLAARGWEVRALVRDPAAFGPPPAGVRLGRCDLPDTLDETLLAGADAVVHAAYATRETDRERARRVNEDGTRRLLEAFARALERQLTGAVTVAEPAPLSLAAFLRAMVARLGVRCLFLPLPLAPVLAALRATEKLRVPLPVRSESLLAIKGLRQVPV